MFHGLILYTFVDDDDVGLYVLGHLCRCWPYHFTLCTLGSCQVCVCACVCLFLWVWWKWWKTHWMMRKMLNGVLQCIYKISSFLALVSLYTFVDVDLFYNTHLGLIPGVGASFVWIFVILVTICQLHSHLLANFTKKLPYYYELKIYFTYIFSRMLRYIIKSSQK